MTTNWNLTSEQTEKVLNSNGGLVYVSAKFKLGGEVKTADRLWVIRPLTIAHAKHEAYECTLRQFPEADIIEINLDL